MNHLEKAKKVVAKESISSSDLMYAAVYAAIAIAEQLEKANDIKLLGDREFAIKWDEDK